MKRMVPPWRSFDDRGLIDKRGLVEDCRPIADEELIEDRRPNEELGLLVRRARVWLTVALVVACSQPATTGSSDTSVPTLRVMTYNIQAGGGNLDNVAEVIRRIRPDVVGLQEVDVHWDARSAFADQAALLAKSLGMDGRFAAIYRIPVSDSTKPPREYGVALLSRCPIRSFKNRMLTRLSTQVASAVPAPMPGFLEATVEVGGTHIRVFSTHLDYRADPRVRIAQVAEMLAIIDETAGPTILAGDLNAQPDAPEVQPLFSKLRDAWLVAGGSGFTYPAKQPVRRIDYVLTSPHFVARSARVPDTQASDHRPVVVELAWSSHTRVVNCS